MMILEVPKDPELLREFGTIAIRHAHLDRILQLTIKTLSGVKVEEAVLGTAGDGSAKLRDAVKKLARTSLDLPDQLRLRALLSRCKHVTERRNVLMHGILAMDESGEHKRETKELDWAPPPTVKELKDLSADLLRVISDLNTARFVGFISAAVATKKPKP